MTLQIGTILIAKEDFGDFTKGKEYPIVENNNDITYRVICNDEKSVNWFDERRINQHFTIKRYAITDLREKKIAVKLRSMEEFKRIGELLNALWSYPTGYDARTYHAIDDDGYFCKTHQLLEPNYIFLDSIDEIDLGDEGKETKVVEIDHLKQLESEIARLKGELEKSQEAGKCIAEKLADEMKEKVAYMEEVKRLKGENERLNEMNQNLNKEINKWIDTATRYKNEITELQLRESPQISQDLEKRERMAWELMLRSVQVENSKHYSLSAEYCLNEVDTFLAKSKEVKL